MLGNKFNEGIILERLKNYIESTYAQHYGKGDIQTTEVTFDAGHGEGFCIGNILKYAQRYGKKDGYNRADLFKVIHYGFLALYNHDTHIKEAESDEN